MASDARIEAAAAAIRSALPYMSMPVDSDSGAHTLAVTALAVTVAALKARSGRYGEV